MDVWMRGGREREGEEREGEERERRGRGEGEERGRGREAGRQRKIRCEARVWEIRLTGPPNRLMWYGAPPPRRRQHPRRRFALRRRAAPRRIPVCTTGRHRRRGLHPGRARSALRPARRARAGVPAERLWRELTDSDSGPAVLEWPARPDPPQAQDILSRRAGLKAPAFGAPPQFTHTHAAGRHTHVMTDCGRPAPMTACLPGACGAPG